MRGLMNSWVLISGLLRPLWDDVDWTVEGTHALSGRYRSKADFIAATFGRLQGVLVGGRNSKVRHIYVDGDTTIAELRSVSKTNEGATFANGYCWVCRFDGGMIVEVRAYLDSAPWSITPFIATRTSPGSSLPHEPGRAVRRRPARSADG